MKSNLVAKCCLTRESFRRFFGNRSREKAFSSTNDGPVLAASLPNHSLFILMFALNYEGGWIEVAV